MSFQLPIEEEQLLVLCLRSERTAQKALYDKYKDAMFTLAMRITNNYDDTCDCLQDAFIQVFRDLKSFNRQSTLGAWIKTIVIRTATKKIARMRITESIEDINENRLIEWPERLNAEYLNKAIKELPEGYRLVFLLNEVEGYTHKETAQILNISEGTSKSQLFYAKKMLQKKLVHLI